jgi:hypothetical protein
VAALSPLPSGDTRASVFPSILLGKKFGPFEQSRETSFAALSLGSKCHSLPGSGFGSFHYPALDQAAVPLATAGHQCVAENRQCAWNFIGYKIRL